MESIFSKTTLYDIMSMIIPGFITLLSLIEIFHGYDSVFEMLKSKGVATAIYILAFALSYLAGIIIHELGHFLFLWFKDCPRSMRCAYDRYHKKLQLKGEESDMDIKENDNKIIGEYYQKYYEVVKPGSSVSMMESQVAFLRSMLFVLPIGVRAIYEYFLPCLSFCWVFASTAVTWAIVFVVMYYLQVRIYFRIFEDYYYQKIIGEKGKAVIEGEFSEEGVKVKLFPDK